METLPAANAILKVLDERGLIAVARSGTPSLLRNPLVYLSRADAVGSLRSKVLHKPLHTVLHSTKILTLRGLHTILVPPWRSPKT
jgi:hypothetical protein